MLKKIPATIITIILGACTSMGWSQGAAQTLVVSISTDYCLIPGKVRLTANPVPAATSYVWSTGATTQSIDVDRAGYYTVTAFGADGSSGQATINVGITLESAPGTDAQTICINTPIQAIRYAVGNGSTAGPTVTGLPSGIIFVFTGDEIIISGTPTIAGNYSYTITTTGCVPTSVKGTINVDVQKITLTSGSTFQSVCSNSPITNIVYTLGGSATGVSVTGLPAGVTGSLSGNKFTISGTPKVAPGSYTYVVITSGNCPSAPSVGVITVFPAPTGWLTVTETSGNTPNDGIVCPGASVMLTAPSGFPAYNFLLNGAYVQSSASRTYTTSALTDGDKVTVAVINTSGCAGLLNEYTITVNPLSVLGPITGNTSICANTTTTLSNATTGGIWSSRNVAVATVDPGTGVVTGVTAGTATIEYSYNNANGCTSAVSAAVTVNPLLTATVIATENSGIPNNNVICAGSSVTFTATLTNEITAPVYQWKKNGINVGSNSKIYTNSRLKDGDSIYCMVTSNGACANSSTVKSNVVKMTVNQRVIPTVSIAASPGISICPDMKATFAATAINGGTAPVYLWKKNVVTVGTNSKTYVDSTLKTGDSIYCILTSNAGCVTKLTAKSNGIKMTVKKRVTPTVRITVSPNDSVCSGSKVTFTATVTNAGSTPIYQWKKNGVNVGTNRKSYTNSALKNGDSVYCILTTNASCTTTPTAKSDGIKMSVSKCLTTNSHFQLSAGLKNEASGLSVIAAPNPSVNSFRLTVTSPAFAKAVVRITGMTGRTVHRRNAILNRGSNVIPIVSSGWSTGAYYVQVIANGETRSCRIIKE